MTRNGLVDVPIREQYLSICESSFDGTCHLCRSYGYIFGETQLHAGHPGANSCIGPDFAPLSSSSPASEKAQYCSRISVSARLPDHSNPSSPSVIPISRTILGSGTDPQRKY